MAFMILVLITFRDLNSNSHVKITNVIISLFPTVIIAFWVVKSNADWRYLGNGILTLGIYTSIYIYFNPIMDSWGQNNILFFSGTLTALGGIVSAHRFLNEFSKKIFYFLTFSICSIAVLLSYLRGQQLFYLIVILFIFFNYLFFTNDKMIKKAIAILCLFALFELMFVGYSVNVIKGEDVLWRYKLQHLIDSADIRITLFAEAWKLFEKNPIIPVGIGGYFIKIGNYEYSYPHNMPLEFAAEFGLIGVIYYLFIVIGALYGYSRFLNLPFIRENLYLFLFMCLISLKQGSLYQAKDFWVWACFGIGLLGWRKNAGTSSLNVRT
jgi:O-antigen ligase